MLLIFNINNIINYTFHVYRILNECEYLKQSSLDVETG